MKTIRLLEEYQCGLLWVYDENGVLEYNDIPEEWANLLNFNGGLQICESINNSCYVEDEKGFRYVGFRSEYDKKRYKSALNDVIAEIKRIAGLNWKIVDDTDKERLK